MITGVICFVLGFITGATTIMVVACIKLAGDIDREEERRQWEKKIP